MNNWVAFGGTILYTLFAIGMLGFLHQARYNSRMLRITGAALWPLTLASMGVGVVLEVVISAFIDMLIDAL